MKKAILVWLNNILQPKWTKQQKRRINEFKFLFRKHYNWDVHVFGITDLKYKFKDERLNVTIYLTRPGTLIGIGGRDIQALQEYLVKHNIYIYIKESKLWGNLR